MKHGKKKRRLSRPASQRRALLKILAADLILKEKITTTEAKAKEMRPFIEKLITKGKSVKPENNLSINRYLARYLPDNARKKLVLEIGLRYQKRSGGYTRITKLALKRADAAKMAVIELVK